MLFASSAGNPEKVKDSEYLTDSKRHFRKIFLRPHYATRNLLSDKLLLVRKPASKDKISSRKKEPILRNQCLRNRFIYPKLFPKHFCSF